MAVHDPPQDMNLYTLAGGMLDARFREALEQIARSIDDVNTDWKTKRSLKIQLDFKPNEQRTAAECAVRVELKLPGRMAVKTTVFVGYDSREKRYRAVEHNPRQMDLSEARGGESAPATETDPKAVS